MKAMEKVESLRALADKISQATEGICDDVEEAYETLEANEKLAQACMILDGIVTGILTQLDIDILKAPKIPCTHEMYKLIGDLSEEEQDKVYSWVADVLKNRTRKYLLEEEQDAS